MQTRACLRSYLADCMCFDSTNRRRYNWLYVIYDHILDVKRILNELL